MGLFRTILIVVLVYFVYKLLKNFMKPVTKERPSVKGKPENHIPPPYDPNQVEDIDYKDVKDQDRDNG